MFPLLPKGGQTKLLKFLIEGFFHLPPVSTTPVENLELWISLRIFKKFETVSMEYSGAGGKLIHEKNQKQKISWHCPFKVFDHNLPTSAATAEEAV
jgi:hypothetical protein